ncbi:type II secretion system protein [uncultured Paludibaculum sp.]|uniref:type II secretion system protein n=1 Tax=uncultured Paludibaculum sp. TaxID=1765020 RepID=UPI002AAB0FDB|nr:type II secretion system protein [uncultured Paludibaculum sp.]
MHRRRGFTLLEVLVATLIMGIAVTGLLSALRTSLRNAARVSETDRAAALARRQMDELLAMRFLPKDAPFGGLFPPDVTGDVPAGWQARVVPMESVAPPGQAPPIGSRMMERIQLEIWWGENQNRRTLNVEAYRGARVTDADIPFLQTGAPQSGGQP